jgi:putative spermidine/putrescine transport system permease protein
MKTLLILAVALVYLFLFLPIIMTVSGSFASSPVLTFPPRGFTLHWYEVIPREYLSALRVSFIVATGATVVATLFGTPAALAIVRGRFIGRDVLNALCLSPLMVPTLVIGVAIFQFSVQVLDAFGLSITETTIGLILAHSVFTIPYVVRAAVAGQSRADATLEEAAMGLGATPFQTFWQVTLPVISPGVTSGAIFAFIMSLDDVPVALFVGGGDATTLPVKIFTAIQFSLGADVLAVATILLSLSVVLMIILDRLVGLNKFFGLSRTGS